MLEDYYDSSAPQIETYFHEYVQEKADRPKVTQDIIYKIEDWYKGYRFTMDSQTVYNPISLLYCLENTGILRPENYWIQTQTHSKTAIEAITEARVRNKNTILNLKKHFSSHQLFGPTENIHPKEISFKSILFQNSYLTIHEFDHESNNYILKFPNIEVIKAFITRS